MKACWRSGRYRHTGEPLGPPRHMTSEIAYSPSWAGDSEHILYQSLDKLKTIDILSGEIREVPLDLTYTPSIPEGPHGGACRPAGGREESDRAHRRGYRDRR